MKRFLFGFAVLSAITSVQSQTNSKTINNDSARQLGSQIGTSLNPNIYQNITTGNPATVVPGYNTNPNQSQYFQNGQGNTTPPGSARVVGCTSQDDVECQAVNLLKQGPVTRPQFTITRNDPLLGKAKGLVSNPTGQIGDIFSSYETCKTTTAVISPLFETQVCNEFSVNEGNVCRMGHEVVVDPDYVYKCLETIQSQANRTCAVGRVIRVDADYNYQCQVSKPLEQYKCRRGFSADIGVKINSQSFNVNKGVEVPTWSARTFDMDFDVDGDPTAFLLKYYRVDNYGQLWINGNKVYENVLPGYTDMRNGSISWKRGGLVYSNSSGVTLGGFYDDGCNWGCRGRAPNLDVTRFIRKGKNTITLVCANANGIGPCQVEITGSAKKLIFLGSLINNQCTQLEQRAQ